MPTANEHLNDSLIRHNIGLSRYANGVQRRVIALLDATEADLLEVIRRRAARLVGRDARETVTQGRLKAMLAEIREVRAKAVSEGFAVWREEMQALVRSEAEYLARAVQTVSPVQMTVTMPETASLKALVTHKPFEGRVLREWASNLQRADLNRITGALRLGLVQGETVDQLTRRVVGTGAMRGANGVTEITRQNVRAITRTAVQSYANAAQDEVMQANRDIFSHERFVATLDARTTPVCRAEDGAVYKAGEGPRPPLHMQCRSIRVPVVDPNYTGQRPMKASTEQGLIREYREREGLEGVRSRADLPRGHRGSFDEFSRQRVRELTGRVPGSTTYQQFLARQSREFQDDVLGARRGQLFRQGGLTLDRFVDRAGRQYTLAELARREAAAFRRAGLNPDSFL